MGTKVLNNLKELEQMPHEADVDDIRRFMADNRVYFFELDRPVSTIFGLDPCTTSQKNDLLNMHRKGTELTAKGYQVPDLL